MNQTQPTNLIAPELFHLLMKIKWAIVDVWTVDETAITENELITEIAIQIRENSDRVGLPLFRIENKFWFCLKNGERIYLPKRSLEKFLLLVCQQLGISAPLRENISFRNSLFGAVWRLLAPEE